MVHGEMLPRPLALHDVVKRGRMQPGRQHLPAHEVALLVGDALVLDAETLANGTARAVARGEV